MARKRLLSQLYPYHIVMLVLSLAAATWYASHVARAALPAEHRGESPRAGPPRRARARAAPRRDAGCGARSIRSARSWEAPPRARITVVLASGKVIGDSDEDPRAHGESRRSSRDRAGRSRAEVGTSMRFSDTEKMNMMYVAVPAERRRRHHRRDSRVRSPEHGRREPAGHVPADLPRAASWSRSLAGARELRASRGGSAAP